MLGGRGRGALLGRNCQLRGRAERRRFRARLPRAHFCHPNSLRRRRDQDVPVPCTLPGRPPCPVTVSSRQTTESLHDSTHRAAAAQPPPLPPGCFRCVAVGTRRGSAGLQSRGHAGAIPLVKNHPHVPVAASPSARAVPPGDGEPRRAAPAPRPRPRSALGPAVWICPQEMAPLASPARLPLGPGALAASAARKSSKPATPALFLPVRPRGGSQHMEWFGLKGP